MTKEAFAAELRVLIPKVQQRMSMKQLSELIGCSRKALYLWKAGGGAPIRIARIGIVALMKSVVES